MTSPLFRSAIVLGLLSAVGPFAIDMFLPALPRIAADLQSAETEAQITITAYFAAFGIAQLFYGPWADQAGRKLPLYVGLVVLLIGSIGCALAPTLGWLVAARVLQGLGAAALGVVPRAIIRDMYTGTEATRLMSMVMLVIAVSPMLAPLAGSALMASGSWRLVFYALALAAVVSLCALAFLQRETLPESDRVKVNIPNLWRGAGELIKDPAYMGLTLIGAFGFSSFFVFIASASFVYTGQFGLSPSGFSIAFAINALGFFGLSQLTAPLSQRFGMVSVMKWGVAGYALFTIALALITLSGIQSLPVIVAFLFCANAFLGLVIPSSMVMALDPHPHIAGLASSLGGALQMIIGGAVVVAMGPFFDGTALPMTVTIGLCGLASATMALLTMGRVARTA